MIVSTSMLRQHSLKTYVYEGEVSVQVWSFASDIIYSYMYSIDVNTLFPKYCTRNII